MSGAMNINDYLKWRGDLRISPTRKFNAVDAMVLSRVSYLPFDRIQLTAGDALEDVTQKMLHLKREEFAWPDDYDFVRLVGESRRFGLMRVSDFVKRNDPKMEKQFSAVTIHISPKEMFLSYFGTDGSLYGWKEDFNMVFMDTVPAQIEAANYFRRLSRKYPWKRVRLGGHSKGGNVAMFAAVSAPDVRQHKIIQVYNFDGPGLSKKIAALDDGMLSILPRIQSFIPQDSVIGRLMEHREKFEVVKSTAVDMYQHDIYSWEVGPEAPVKATATKKSEFIDKTITKWMESATKEQREVFVKVAFEILEKSGAGNPIQAYEKWKSKLPAMIRSYREVPKEDRKVVVEVLRKLLEARKQASVEAASSNLQSTNRKS